mmetsp:Transcript_33691/g.85280  ORF Transcript_33691/g.85280 Transcript_33691/m.85280 type:complete len:202 (+) Transcript_33691:210-815(+)
MHELAKVRHRKGIGLHQPRLGRCTRCHGEYRRICCSNVRGSDRWWCARCPVPCCPWPCRLPSCSSRGGSWLGLRCCRGGAGCGCACPALPCSPRPCLPSCRAGAGRLRCCGGGAGACGIRGPTRVVPHALSRVGACIITCPILIWLIHVTIACTLGVSACMPCAWACTGAACTACMVLSASISTVELVPPLVLIACGLHSP